MTQEKEKESEARDGRYMLGCAWRSAVRRAAAASKPWQPLAPRQLSSRAYHNAASGRAAAARAGLVLRGRIIAPATGCNLLRVSIGARSFYATPLLARKGGGEAALLRAGIQLTGFLLRNLFKAYSRGHISTRMLLGGVTVSAGVVAAGIAAFGVDETMSLLNLGGRQTTVYREVIENMDPAEQKKALESLKEVQDDMQKMGKVKVLAGTEVPPYWESEQKSASTVGTSEWAVVSIQDGTAEWDSLDACLDGNDVGAGGRDATTGKSYTELTLAAAWRVENRTLWAKYAAERQQTASTMANLTDPQVQFRAANPHLRKGLLEASRPLRKDNGCDNKINECYLFHGLGNPAMALNIIQSGMNVRSSRSKTLSLSLPPSLPPSLPLSLVLV
eukprot:COSAG05_NODE_2766_length_2670_cov_4.514809_3_plen_389_part_00